MDEDFEIDINDFENNDFDLLNNFEGDEKNEDDFNIDSRYVKPKKQKIQNSKNIKFINAQKLAKSINLQKKESVFAIVDGSFIFGDFILAFLHYHNIKAVRMDISTLSLNMHNIVGIEHFMKNGYIDNLNFLIGYYFYAHEKKGLIKEMYRSLDIDNRFQIAVCRNHMKSVTILTDRGNKIVMHGSANLRSSDNLEQFSLSFDDKTYDFITEYNDQLIKEFSTIQKPLTNKQILNL